MGKGSAVGRGRGPGAGLHWRILGKFLNLLCLNQLLPSGCERALRAVPRVTDRAMSKDLLTLRTVGNLTQSGLAFHHSKCGVNAAPGSLVLDSLQCTCSWGEPAPPIGASAAGAAFSMEPVGPEAVVPLLLCLLQCLGDRFFLPFFLLRGARGQRPYYQVIRCDNSVLLYAIPA